VPQFRYRALNSQGHELEGTLSAADANAAVVQLSRQGLRLKSIEEGVTVVHATPAVRSVAPAVHNPPPVVRPVQPYTPVASPLTHNRQQQSAGPRYGVKPSRRATYNDRQFFFAQLGGLLRSGISPADALHTILSRSNQSKFQAEFNDMASMCAGGMSLSEALEHYPNMFPSGVVGAVRAGETGGYLPDACESISVQQKETRRIFNMFAILMVAVPWTLFLLYLAAVIAFGIDRAFQPLLDNPEGGTFEQGVSGALTGFVTVLFVLTVIGGVTAYFLGRSRKFRAFRHRVGIAMPMFKRRALNENLSHFSYHLGRLAKSGLSPFASWQLAARAVPNDAYSARLLAMAENLSEQTRLSELLYRSKLFPYETAQLVETGEMTGDLPGAMDQVMQFGREREKQANLYIGMKAGCWTVLVFGIGGMMVLMVIYVTYLLNIGKMMDGM
jgi:type II secretory pathway component PulF